MRINVTGKIPQIKRGYVTQFFKELKEVFLEAARDFVQEAAPTVPVDTGMARGSFLNLLQLLSANGVHANVDVPNTPQRLTAKGKPLTYRHSTGRRFPKTPASARKLSTNKQILRRVGYRFVFTYESRVLHLNINDEFGPTWHSFRRGREQFLKRLKTFKPPSIKDWLILTTVSHGRDFSTQLRDREQFKVT